jgi:hypothetical protein
MKLDRPKMKPKKPLFGKTSFILLILFSFLSVNCGAYTMVFLSFSHELFVLILTAFVLLVLSLVGWIILSAILWEEIKTLRQRPKVSRTFHAVDTTIGERFSDRESKPQSTSDEIKPE